jgi:hypothetical protein
MKLSCEDRLCRFGVGYLSVDPFAVTGHRWAERLVTVLPQSTDDRLPCASVVECPMYENKRQHLETAHALGSGLTRCQRSLRGMLSKSTCIFMI